MASSYERVVFSFISAVGCGKSVTAMAGVVIGSNVNEQDSLLIFGFVILKKGDFYSFKRGFVAKFWIRDS